MKKTLPFLFLLFSLNLFSQTYSELSNTGLENKSLGSIATGDLNNDGYLDVITTGIDESSELSTSLYINDQDGTFTKLNVELTPLYNATIALGDYNNDGFLDILLAGEGYDPLSSLWKNNGDLSFTEVDAGLADLGGTNAEFRDIDNDGDLDILLSGSIRNENGSYSRDLRLYSNEGNDSFVEVELSFTSYAVVGSLGDFDNDGDLDLLSGGGSLEIYPNNGDGTFSSPQSYGSFPAGEMKWFDFNNDGNLDFIVSGRGFEADEYFTKVYQNVGVDNDWFVELQDTDFANPRRGKLDIRDYNNDGNLDLFITGTLDFSTNSFVSKIYDNSGSSFFENSSISLPQLGSGDGSWFDIDNDGDLDLILTGEEVQGANVKKTVVYRNDGNDNINTVNSIPNAPSALSWTWVDDITTFSWEAGSDNETPTLELGYNLGVGSDIEASNILFPESNNDGSRLIQKLGNAQNNTTKTITSIEDGIYYFKVQSIDGALTGSEFSESEKFAVGIPTDPSNASASSNSNEDIVITWTDNSVNEFSFVIEQKSNINSDYTEIGSTNTDENSFSISSLEDAIYTFKIKAVNPNGESEYIETNDVAVGIPTTPSNFTATLNDRSVSLSWDDLVNERNYKLERSANEGESYEVLATLEMDIEEYLDENLAPGLYSYRIQSINENGESDFVNSDISIEIVLSIDDSKKANLSIYPNPAIQDFVYLKTSDKHMLNDIQISDLTGKKLSLQVTNVNNLWRIDFADVQSGIYIIKTKKGDEIISQRIIIE